ncbi:T9SS type A sorting domain-containing protein [Lacinutrix gracilariae]|uniref:T9SS type A sorting domain-containing protein n=1 Tax=Lacinutrix gracilariae TaxID=1747198 RepID=A0ABW5K2Y2_9FLAO
MKKIYLLLFTLCSITAAIGQNEITEFSIYPNPVTNGVVNIKSSNNEAVSVSIYNVLGKQVLAQNITNQILNVSSLNAGVYVLKLTQNGNSIAKKLVIK